MRLLLVANYKKGRGGISGQVEIIQQKLTKEGHVVDIFQTKGSLLYRIGVYWKLKSAGKKYDVLHVHCCSGIGFFPAVIGVLTGRRIKKPIVLTYHGGGAGKFFKKHSKLVSYFLRRTNCNIVLSGFVGSIFDKYQLPYTIIPNAIELDRTCFRNREILKPNFICTRTLDPLYNHECIFKAFELVKRQLPLAMLTLVGGGTLLEDLMQLSASMGLKDVTFTGRVDNSEIFSYLDKSDIMVSAPHIDNMPVSLLEGFNAGLLVISSSVGGVPYMIEDGKNGLLFKDDDYQELAEKMLWAIDNQPLDMINDAFKRLDYYSWNNVYGLLMKIYNEVCR